MSGGSGEAAPLLGGKPGQPGQPVASYGAVPAQTADTAGAAIPNGHGPAPPAASVVASPGSPKPGSSAAAFQGDPELRKRLPYLFPALGIGVFLAAADQTIIVSAAGRIGSDLGALQQTGWIASAYLLSLTSIQPLYGKLSDIFSRKSCLLFAYLIFGLGCLWCGLAQSIESLIAARFFAGIGGAGMTVVVSIVLSDTIPLQDRGTWQGYINIVYASGAAVGAPAGGMFADGIGWRWGFLVQPILCAAAFVAVALVMPATRAETSRQHAESTPDGAEGVGDADGQERQRLLRDDANDAVAEHPLANGDANAPPATPSWKSKLRRIDFLGSLSLVAAVFSLILGLDRGSNLSWASPWALVPLCLSAPLFVLFGVVETRVAAEPIAPRHLIAERTLLACYFCNFFSFAGFLATLFYVPLYFQAVKGYSATHSAVLLLPNVAASVSGSLSAGFIMKKTGKYYALNLGFYSTMVVGVALVVVFSGLESDVGICMSLCVAGFSNGVGVTSSLIALISNAGVKDQAIATACSYLFRSLGSTTGISLSTTVANSVLRSALEQRLRGVPDREIEHIIASVRRSLKSIRELDPDLAAIVRACYKTSTRAAFGLQCGLVLGAALAALWIREKPLKR